MSVFTPFIAGQIWTATICNFLAGGWISIDGAGIFTFSSADGHTFVMNTPADCTGFIGVGQRIQLTQGTVKYFIVTAITATQITMYGGQNYTLTSGAISVVSSSPFKAPVGFPLDATGWTEKTVDAATRAQATPVANTWYNPGAVSLIIPIGAWNLSWQTPLQSEGPSGLGQADVYGSLSTANNSASDSEFTTWADSSASGITGNDNCNVPGYVSKPVLLASKTTYYLVVKTDVASSQALAIGLTVAPSVIRAVCAYL